VTEKPRGTVLALSRGLLTTLGLDRLLLQQIRRQEQDAKVTRPAAPVQQRQAQPVGAATARRRARRRLGITARQQRLGMQVGCKRPPLRRYRRLTGLVARGVDLNRSAWRFINAYAAQIQELKSKEN
jgi:hypothetical protein